MYDVDDEISFNALEQHLQIARNQRLSIVNAPPDWALRLLAGTQPRPEEADVVVAFATRRVDLAWIKSAYSAAHAARVAWIIYPKPGRPGSDLRWDWLIHALRQYGLDVVDEVSINQAWSALRLRPSGGVRESVELGDYVPLAAVPAR